MASSILSPYDTTRSQSLIHAAGALAIWMGLALAGTSIGVAFYGLWQLAGIPASVAANAWTGTAALLFLGLGLTALNLRVGLFHAAFAVALFGTAFSQPFSGSLSPILGPILQAAWATAYLANDAESDRHPLLFMWAAANLTIAAGLM